MKVKITLTDSDDFVLISAIRGIAAQIDGWDKVQGQTNLKVKYTEALELPFADEDRARRFERAVRKYIASEFQLGIKIEISN